MNDDHDLTRRVRGVLAATLELSEAELPDDPSPQSLACWTSLRHMTLLAALEEEFAVTFSIDDVKAMTSLGQIVAHLRRHADVPIVEHDDLSTRLAMFSAAHAGGRRLGDGEQGAWAANGVLSASGVLSANGYGAVHGATALAEAAAPRRVRPVPETIAKATTLHPAASSDAPAPDWSSGRSASARTDGSEAHIGRLPHCLNTYIKSPRQTEQKARHWLNARWQLRGCDRLGRWTRVNGKVSLDNQGHTYIGERVLFHAHHAPTYLTTFPEGTLVIGDRTFINFGADIVATELVSIGSDCLIGTYVMMLDNDFHDIVDRARMPKPRPIVIGDEVWIGNRSIILPGVTIGQGAVVGAGSVVVSDVPAWTVVAGNPARVIKEL